MHEEYLDIINRRLEPTAGAGQSKVMPLDEAVRRFIKPGMTIHMGVSHCRPNAASNEIIRQFWGADPGFTLAMIGVVANQIIFVHGGLVKKIIGTFFGDSYPTPGPNRLIQKAFRDKTVEFENWSILTFPQRLMAGAMGVPWMPTKSLAGSSMASENGGSYIELEDPSARGEKIGMVRALVPDVSILHGWCADAAGNILVTPPYGENIFGALAARGGVVATVEKLVPMSYIREHAALVKIPGYAVRSVSVAPMGGHPSGLTNIGVPDLPAYAEDYAFIEELRNASRKDDTYDAWIKHWVLDCRNHDEYMAKLGHEKIFYLRGKADPQSWRDEMEDHSPNLCLSEKHGSLERMIVASGRIIERKIKEKGHKTILAGVGASNLAAWLATIACGEDNVEVDCMAELGFYGYLPRPGDPYIFNHRNVHTCKMLAGIDTVMGMLMGGANSKCIGVIGAAQVDKFGNVNSTCVPEAKMFLVGSGGANDVASAAAEVLVCVESGSKRQVEKVSHITSPGKSVKTIVTELAVWERDGNDDAFALTTILDDGSGRSIEDRIDEVINRTGWKLDIAENVGMEPPPSREELLTLRLFDPKRQFIGPDPEG